VDANDSVMAEAASRESKTTPITIDTTTPTTTATTDPWMLFLYALKAPVTKEKYIQRLIKFLDFLGYQGTKEEKARAFAAQAKADPAYPLTVV
jgi:transcription initiation factor TFIIIB Brf1 subunit/transcription initiation factor TFIIB